MENPTSILVTGASRGLGLATVKSLVERGETVIGFARSESIFEATKYTHIQGDVTDETSVRNLFKKLRKDGVIIDRVINSAGLSQTHLALVTSADEARRIMDVNFIGTFLISKYATRSMMSHGFGRIVALSSINVSLHSRGGCIYNSSKSACETLMQTLTSESKNVDITYNALRLSIVDATGMADELSDEAAKEKRVRLDKPENLNVDEVIYALDFLFGPLASKISGQILTFGAP